MNSEPTKILTHLEFEFGISLNFPLVFSRFPAKDGIHFCNALLEESGITSVFPYDENHHAFRFNDRVQLIIEADEHKIRRGFPGQR